MRRLIQALSPSDEYVIVVAAAFAPLIVTSISAFLFVNDSYSRISDADLRSLVVGEVVLLTILSAFLHVRGWTLERIGLNPNLRETLLGLGLLVGSESASWLAWFVAALSSESVRQAGDAFGAFAKAFEPTTTIAVSIVNPIFEEALLCGYMVTALKGRTHWAIVAGLTIGVRTLCHVYQGIVGIIFIIPMGVVFTWFYFRYGRLWPLIVAHVVLDFFPLLWLGRD